MMPADLIIKGRVAFCREVCAAAGDRLRAARMAGSFEVRYKHGAELVTSVDEELDAQIREKIGWHFPGDAIASEETDSPDGFYEGDLAPWDVAAAGLIAREAGAVCGHLDGVPPPESPDLCGSGIVAAGPRVFPALMELLRAAD